MYGLVRGEYVCDDDENFSFANKNWFTRRCILNCMCILFNWILHVEQFINIRWHDHQCFNSSEV